MARSINSLVQTLNEYGYTEYVPLSGDDWIEGPHFFVEPVPGWWPWSVRWLVYSVSRGGRLKLARHRTAYAACSDARLRAADHAREYARLGLSDES